MITKKERLKNKGILEENNKNANKAFIIGFVLLLLFGAFYILFPDVIRTFLNK